MSRNRNRGRSAPESIVPAVEAATPVSGAVQPVQPNRHERRRQTKAPAAPAFVFSRPVVVDLSKSDIDDFVLVSQIAAFGQKGDNAGLTTYVGAHAVELIAFLDRVVVGGTKGRPMSEFMPLLTEVISRIGTQGN